MAPSGVILYSPGPGRYLEGTAVGCTTVGGTGWEVLQWEWEIPGWEVLW